MTDAAANAPSHVYVVIGHERYPEEGEGIVGVYADQEDAQAAIADPEEVQ